MFDKNHKLNDELNDKLNEQNNLCVNSDVIKQKLFFNDDIENLPEDIQISTMTIVCKINMIFNVENIAKYIDLKPSAIISVKHGKSDDISTNRTLITKKKNNKNKIKKK